MDQQAESALSFLKRKMDAAECAFNAMPLDNNLERRVAHLEYRIACLEYDACTRFVHRSMHNQQ